MKKKTLSELKKDLWDLCKKIIRLKYPPICYTCGKGNIQGSDWQTGHGKPKGALSLRYQYDLRNLRPQCMHCNLNLGGCSDIFISKLEREREGLEFLLEACFKTNEGWKIKQRDLMGSLEAYKFVEDKIKEYKNLLVK